ncbi:MAG: twin-arginine translocase TatA/TatE family subunit [Proteobacteria bacterium]|nr:twin-arginine translocase TatA/TatE family subunit [Pseudomonadota bacterium]
MGSMSIWHWLVLLVIVLLLFGAGKIPKLMGDMAKGVKAFKAGLKDFEDEPAKPETAPPQPAAAQAIPGEAKKEAPRV